MADIKFEQFFWIPNLVYSSVGVNFITPATQKWKCYLRNTYFLCMAGIHLYGRHHMQKQLYQTFDGKDVSTFIQTGAYLFYGIDSNIKYLAFILNQKRLRNVLNILKELYPKTIADKVAYRTNSFYWSKVVRFFVGCYFIGDLVVLLFPLAESVFRHFYCMWKYEKDEYASFAYLKPFPNIYDFDHRTPFGYFFAYLFDLANGLFTSVTNIGTDLWIIAYVKQLNMHLEYICCTLENYVPNEATPKEDCMFLSEILQKQFTVYYVHDELNAIFGLSLIFSLISTSSALCFIGMQIVVNLDAVIYLPFIISMIAQLYLVCYYGQQLISMSQMVATAAYKSRWYCGSQSYKTMILFIIMRSQKQAALSAKGFQTVSLHTFQTVMGMTYRIFAIIRTAIVK